jgi:hypothetical protein
MDDIRSADPERFPVQKGMMLMYYLIVSSHESPGEGIFSFFYKNFKYDSSY